MKAKTKAKFKNFAKFLLLAQAASDAGKGYISVVSINGRNAVEKGYSLKDDYIRQAIVAAEALDFVQVGLSSDINMTVVLFNIRGYGQISFHSISEYSRWSHYEQNVLWNNIRGGSPMTSKRIAKELNLPWYNHGRKKRN